MIVVDASPSCPASFFPQQRTFPDANIAQEKSSPLSIEAANVFPEVVVELADSPNTRVE